MDKKKRLGILGKLLLGIIPVVIIGINAVSLVSGQLASNALLDTTDKYMSAELNGNMNNIDSKLQQVRTAACSIRLNSSRRFLNGRPTLLSAI